MHNLRPKSLMRLMKRGLVCGLAALSLSVMCPVQPAVQAEELAVLSSPSSSRILLDLQKRQISVIRGGQSLGPWPVAIGDPKTPTPVGQFSILNKKVNPVYVSNKSGSAKR